MRRSKAGCHLYRPVSESVRPAAVSRHQSSHQTAHLAGLARRDPQLYSHHRWQHGRCAVAGHPVHRSWCLLGDGSGLPALHPPVQAAPAGAFFVTHAKHAMAARRVYSAAADHATSVICDQTIYLNGINASKGYPEHLRHIRYKRPRLRQAADLPDIEHPAPHGDGPDLVPALDEGVLQIEPFAK